MSLESRFCQLCELDWIHVQRLQMGFFSDPLLFLSLFTSLIHSASFYFRTDESLELHLKFIYLSSLIPNPGFLCLCSYFDTHARCLTHTSPLPRIRDLSKSVHTQTDYSTWGGQGGDQSVQRNMGYVLHCMYIIWHKNTHASKIIIANDHLLNRNIFSAQPNWFEGFSSQVYVYV